MSGQTRILALSWLMICFASPAATDAARAQGEAPFSTVVFSLSLGTDVLESDFQRYWNTGPTVDIAATTPFYYGDFRTAVRVMQARSTDLTDIRTAYFYVSWGPSLSIGRSLSGSIEVAVGSFYMLFADEAVSYRKSESELAAGLRAGLSGRLHGPLGAQLHLDWQRAFTSTPVDLLVISGGVTYALDSPGWLRRFLD